MMMMQKKNWLAMMMRTRQTDSYDDEDEQPQEDSAVPCSEENKNAPKRTLLKCKTGHAWCPIYVILVLFLFCTVGHLV